MILLHLVPKAIYDTKMSRVRFEEVEALKLANPPMRVYTTGPGWEDWPPGATPEQYVLGLLEATKNNRELQPQLILSYGVEGLSRVPIPTIMIFHETYNYPKTMRAIRDTGAKLVIFTYTNDLALYQPELEAEDRLLYSIPHSATQEIYKDYGLEKDVDVLIVGNLAEQFYPFRYRLARLAKRELAKRGYRVVHLPHPGFTLPPREYTAVGEEYAQWLNRSKVVVTCCSKQKYAFCKLVEIPLCNALPVSDLPAERRGFFRQTLLNVEPWMLDREILAKVEDVLDDDALRLRLTTIAHDKVASRLEMRHWAERFIFACRRLLLGEDPTPPTAPVGDEDHESW
jgi:hypothetical protein